MNIKIGKGMKAIILGNGDVKVVMNDLNQKGVYWNRIASNKKGALGDLLNFLSVEPRTEHELYRYLRDISTGNEASHAIRNNKIRLLTISIFTRIDDGFVDNPASELLKREVIIKGSKGSRVIEST